MKNIFAVGLFTLLLLDAAGFAEVENTRFPERLHTTVDGVSIEYSPGLEAYIPGAAAAAKVRRESMERQLAHLTDTKAPPLPLSARDLRENRTAILARIAHEIGLEKPTELQERCYDTMLEAYQMNTMLRYAMARAAWSFFDGRSCAIWLRSDLIKRLEAGEKIPGMSWDPKTEQGSFDTKFNFDLQPTPEMKERIEAAKTQRLTHALNYSVDKDGVANIKASFTIHSPRKKGDKTKEAKYESFDPYADFNRKVDEEIAKMNPYPTPIFVPDDSPPSEIDAVIKRSFSDEEEFGKSASDAVNYRDGQLALVVLHETTEVGIVETYLGSADRRWFCDGVANYVAWKIAQERAGENFARQVYDLDGHLKKARSLQGSVDLRKWAAVEREEANQTKSSDLIEAHYAFATRAVKMMVDQNGQDLLPRLFREIARTPRHKASYKTVRKAYQKVADQKLDAVVKAAEDTAIPE